MWDLRRNARIFKRQPQPGGELGLFAESAGRPGGEWGGDTIEGLRVSYWLEGDGDLLPLEDVQWADWDKRGRLLVATRCGKLQVRELRGLAGDVAFEHDLAPLAPEPTAPPAWAEQW